MSTTCGLAHRECIPSHGTNKTGGRPFSTLYDGGKYIYIYIKKKNIANRLKINSQADHRNTVYSNTFISLTETATSGGPPFLSPSNLLDPRESTWTAGALVRDHIFNLLT